MYFTFPLYNKIAGERLFWRPRRLSLPLPRMISRDLTSLGNFERYPAGHHLVVKPRLQPVVGFALCAIAADPRAA